MSEIVILIKENSTEIIVIVVVVLFLLVVMNIKGINLNKPKTDTKIVQQVTVETFDIQDTEKNIINQLTSSSQNFCESYLGQSIGLEESCNQLTKTHCGEVKCCVYGNGKCVAGDLNGPTYKTDKDGKLITIDSYYYLGKKMVFKSAPLAILYPVVIVCVPPTSGAKRSDKSCPVDNILKFVGLVIFILI